MWNEEHGLLNSIHANPNDDLPRLVYADWLEERGDPRSDFVRLHLELRATAPDHIDRVAAEHELSELRKCCDVSWLAVIEPEKVRPGDDPYMWRGCNCFEAGYDEKVKWSTPYFHNEAQDTECDAWKRLLELIEEAAADGLEEFAPLNNMSPIDRSKILTLPATIAKLKAVKTLQLYGSCLTRIPSEIREMTSLVEFDPYTSYRLHWYPYELSHCPNLRDSRVSTRALYGNIKYRPPFPKLDDRAPTPPDRAEPTRLTLKRWPTGATRACSVCNRQFEDRRRYRVWISLRVATDVLPLLVNACSAECIANLPPPAKGYVANPHTGGMHINQPGRK